MFPDVTARPIEYDQHFHENGGAEFASAGANFLIYIFFSSSKDQ